ncbi:MAG: DUF192 domain-containing protein [Alphaproteobacteria bacterium]|nr:DUF192 domain-containing protein [Alphaproteobacteria bacterium]
MTARLLRFSSFILFVILGAALPAVIHAASTLEPVTIETASGDVTFDVEVMRTEEERQRGLMARAYLPETRGMLFDFGQPQDVRMWMKDTPLPLDMLFIRADGTIARITRGEPFSTRTLPSGEPVLGVLEINGGISARLGIKEGGLVRHKLFGTEK